MTGCKQHYFGCWLGFCTNWLLDMFGGHGNTGLGRVPDANRCRHWHLLISWRGGFSDTHGFGRLTVYSWSALAHDSCDTLLDLMIELLLTSFGNFLSPMLHGPGMTCVCIMSYYLNPNPPGVLDRRRHIRYRRRCLGHHKDIGFIVIQIIIHGDHHIGGLCSGICGSSSRHLSSARAFGLPVATLTTETAI